MRSMGVPTDCAALRRPRRRGIPAPGRRRDRQAFRRARPVHPRPNTRTLLRNCIGDKLVVVVMPDETVLIMCHLGLMLVVIALFAVQASKPALSPIVSPTESPRTSLDQTEAAPQQQSRLQNGTRLTTRPSISAVTVSSDGGSEPVDDFLTQYSGLYSSGSSILRTTNPSVSAARGAPHSPPAAEHGSATAAEVAAVAAAFGDYDPIGSSRAESYPEAQQSVAATSPFAPAR